MVDVFIGLGSNVGEREGNLTRAIELLSEKLKVIKVSSMYETEPMYLKNQRWFVNCVAKFQTNLKPMELLVYLKEVEQRLGRQEAVKYGPRIIDLDVLFYGDEIVEESLLRIPHPNLHERPFVLVPLAEIDPEHVHPVYKESISALLAKVHSKESVRKL